MAKKDAPSSDQSTREDKPREGFEPDSFEAKVESLAERYFEACRRMAKAINTFKKKRRAD